MKVIFERGEDYAAARIRSVRNAVTCVASWEKRTGCNACIEITLTRAAGLRLDSFLQLAWLDKSRRQALLRAR